MIKVLSLFSGIGSPEQALKNIGMDYELIGFSEIDKYAVKSYCAIHNVSPDLNLGDISKIDISKLSKDVDLITHGSPCQDFSVAGNNKGGDKGSGTRSSLMWYTVDIVEFCRPKFVLWENVKNLLSKKHRHNFDAYLEIMEKLGYNNYYKVLNAKDYGIPQNRERVFTISIRKDIDDGSFKFPKPITLKLRLKDLLEKEVDRKFYLSDKQIHRIKTSSYHQNARRIQEKDVCDTLCARDWKDPKCVEVDAVRLGGIFDTEKIKHQAGSVWDKNKISPTIDTMQGGYRQPLVIVKEATKKGYAEAYDGDSINLEQPNSKTRRGRVGKQVAQTLTTAPQQAVVNDLSIRKLTPKECWRLMGFKDEQFQKAEKICSNTQLYKQAGNSIVVNVLESIFKQLLNL